MLAFRWLDIIALGVACCAETEFWAEITNLPSTALRDTRDLVSAAPTMLTDSSTPCTQLIGTTWYQYMANQCCIKARDGSCLQSA